VKLFAKYNRVNIVATVVVLVIGGICYYLILHFVLLKQLDNDLNAEEQEIKNYILLNHLLPVPTNTKEQEIIFKESTSAIKRKIESKKIYKKEDDEYEICRILFFAVNVSGKNYNVYISQSQEATENLMQLIASITLGLVLLLLFILFIVNRFILNKLWHPFNTTLAKLKEFDINKNQKLQLNTTKIDEFIDLNYAVTKMNESVIRDYNALKSFTENASHEIQTPLAIVNTKLELLIQSENFTAAQMQNIQTIHNEINRLSKLNKSLLLLTKIDNHQFEEKEEVDIVKIITTLLNNYDELFTAKKINLIKEMETTVFILMNETMAQVLVSNLINNAIKHNIDNGTINIFLNNTFLLITNTGTALQNYHANMFERFKKDKMDSDSLGLGLSIVKRICDLYNFTVTYNYENNLHSIKIVF
jgi:signal transduction histidine kinase